MAELTLTQLADRVARVVLVTRMVESLLPQIRLLSVSGAREHFRTKVGPDGVPWPPLRRPRVNGGTQQLQDTGRLMQSIGARASAKEIILYAASPGANAHQYGMTVRPVRAKYLAVPMTRQAKRAGSPRLGRFRGKLFAVTAGRSRFLAETDTRGRTVFHYLLLRSARIPRRRFLGWSAGTLEKIDRLLTERAAEYLAQTFSPVALTQLNP